MTFQIGLCCDLYDGAPPLAYGDRMPLRGPIDFSQQCSDTRWRLRSRSAFRANFNKRVALPTGFKSSELRMPKSYTRKSMARTRSSTYLFDAPNIRRPIRCANRCSNADAVAITHPSRNWPAPKEISAAAIAGFLPRLRSIRRGGRIASRCLHAPMPGRRAELRPSSIGVINWKPITRLCAFSIAA